jgi:hypothetical protein
MTDRIETWRAIAATRPSRPMGQQAAGRLTWLCARKARLAGSAIAPPIGVAAHPLVCALPHLWGTSLPSIEAELVGEVGL